MSSSQSVRSKIVMRRTYNRPLDETGKNFETWEQTVDRVIGHQQWLWERAKGRDLNKTQKAELEELRALMLNFKVATSGRTLWLGGTNIAKTRESSQFNCSFLSVETVHDVVDAFWLLLQGTGVGFRAVNGTLNGFAKETEIEIIRSEKTIEDWKAGHKGRENNQEYFSEEDGKRIWTLSVGDSAEAWAKSVGKLLAVKEPVDRIVIDLREIRAGGIRLKGYGWISSGDETFHKALIGICGILNRRAGQLLTKMNIHDILNWIGTTLSSRRSAEISLMDVTDPEVQEFALCKKDHWEKNPQRAQSNNTVIFYNRPSKIELRGFFDLMREGGGSEPGFANGEAALLRAPWWKGNNPCFEILLGNKSFCNLFDTNLTAFNEDFTLLQRAIYIAARANYRQTCVNLDDGILQRTWHELNQFLRLTGVGLTGIVGWEYVDVPERFQLLREAAHAGVHSMADELGLPRSKAVTTIKPSGTLSKIMDCTEGAHKPLGKYIFNNINLSRHDPLVGILEEAGYYLFDNPYDTSSILVRIPVSYEETKFDEVERDGETLYVNLESAISQLERYKLLMENYVDHNTSITVSYSPEEVPQIVNWLYSNWDEFIGVSFLYRNAPPKTAADLGYPYLPQEVVTKSVFDEYIAGLKEIDLDASNSFDELEEDECAGGACPVK